MNGFLQAALGLAPGLLVFALLGFLGKKARVRNFALAGLFALAIGGLTVGAFLPAPQEQNGEAIQEQTLAPEEALALVYAQADEGDPAGAIALLRELTQDLDYSQEFTLCMARLYAQKGDYGAARGLYAKLPDSPEKAAVGEAVTDPQKQASAARQVQQAIHRAAAGTASDLYGALRESDRLYGLYLAGEYEPAMELELLRTTYKNLRDRAPGLFRLSVVQKGYLKTQLMAEDYSAMAASLDQTTGVDALMVLSQLYIQGAIDEESFDGSALAERQKVARVVLRTLDRLYKQLYDPQVDLAAYNDAGDFIRRLKEQIKSPGSFFLRSSMLAYTGSEDATDSSKVYLQLSRLEDHLGQTEQSMEYLDKALLTVESCRDDSFSAPMLELVTTVSTRRDDTERLKQVPKQVDRALNNLMPFQVPESQAAPEEGQEQDYAQKASDQIVKKRAQLNILGVDTSQFPKITATINVDAAVSYDAKELQSMLYLTDCRVDIQGLHVQKEEFNAAHILLCCDVSGSMSGDPIADLRAAITDFISTSDGIERISLLCFDGGIVTKLEFGSSKEALLDAASNLGPEGGTNIFGAMSQCVNMFPDDPNCNNFIILLSDGADGNPASQDRIRSTIADVCAGKNIQVYAVGVGDSVDSTYLNYFTLGTGGYYIHAADSASLTEFFAGIRSQSLNRYTVTYTAQDTASSERQLYIQLRKDKLANDTYYYDKDGHELDSEDGSYLYRFDTLKKYNTLVSVSGVDKKLIYRGQAQTLNLRGSGFVENLDLKLELSGNVSYKDLMPTYVSSDTFSFQIPASIACGTYDLRVSIDGKTAVLADEITVVTPGSEKQVAFGPYVFTAYSAEYGKDQVKLSNYVTMNGWLNFNGPVTLKGDLTDYRVTLEAPDGACIYYDPADEGIAAFYGNLGIGMNIPMPDSFRLMNDPLEDPNSLTYPTDDVVLPSIYVTNVLEVASCGMHLYPGMAQITANEFDTKFPFQDQIVKAAYNKPFTFDLDASLLLHKKAIDLKVDGKAKLGNDETPVKILSVESRLGSVEAKVKIDTLENKYELDLGVEVNFMKSDKNDYGVGLHLAWNDDLQKKICPSEVVLKANFPVKGNISGVPVTYENFILGLENIDPNSKPIYWTLVGGLDISAGKIKDFLPGVEEFTGNFNICALEDAKLSLNVGKGYLGAKGKVTFCTVELGSFQIDIGNFSYTNRILYMDDVNATGLRVSAKIGMKWDANNCDIDIGGTGELNLHSRFLGLQVNGNIDMSVHWWVFKASVDRDASINLGMWTDNQKAKNFGVIVTYDNYRNKTKQIFVVYNENTGSDSGRRTL